MNAAKYITKICSKHNESKFVLEGRGYYRCTKCRMEAVQRRRDKLKEKAIAYKGGKCVQCGYFKCSAALEFHHKDKNRKDYGISHSGYTRSWDKVKKELDKCILLCSNCHREIHNEALPD